MARRSKSHRTVLEGILRVLRTGSPRRALPKPYGSWKTVSSRIYRWQTAGIWARVLAALMERGAVKRRGRGRPRVRPARLAGDTGYSSPAVRRYLTERRIGAVIPTKAAVDGGFLA